GSPVILSVLIMVLVGIMGVVNETASIVYFALAAGVMAVAFLIGTAARDTRQPTWHALLEGRGLLFTVLTIFAVLIGGVAEIVPSVVAAPEQIATTQNQPYSALEVEGRDVYLAEGCYVCHSQMIRPFTWESARYGQVSVDDDSIFDHPFQWGSRRIGPDLARIGGRYPDVWHYRHMLNPREISPGSNMPPYAHLGRSSVDLCEAECADQACRSRCLELAPDEVRAVDPVDFDAIAAKMRALRIAGVPYDAETIAESAAAARRDAAGIAEALREEGIVAAADSRLIALISYLQRVGQNTSPTHIEGDRATVPAEVAFHDDGYIRADKHVDERHEPMEAR
ncbi:MAG: cbb3-type cytochrome c oxidase subunit II, partial [Myxococcota bacterium]